MPFKLHVMAFIAVQLREAAALYSRVKIQEEQVTTLKTCCQQYFTAHCLFLAEVSPTVWTIGYAIPHHTDQLFKEKWTWPWAEFNAGMGSQAYKTGTVCRKYLQCSQTSEVVDSVQA